LQPDACNVGTLNVYAIATESTEGHGKIIDDYFVIPAQAGIQKRL
jgi:hypothetical protein